MVCESVADSVRATCRWCSSKLPAAAQGTWAHQRPTGSDGDRASCRWCSSHLGAPRLDWFRWCASQPPAATQGMSRWLSSHLDAPRLDWFRWCARHKPRVVEAPERTKARVVPMVIEPLADGVRATCRWCSSKLPAAAQGMCRWLPRYLGAPRPDWFRR